MLKLQKEDYKSNALKDFARLYERESGKQFQKYCCESRQPQAHDLS